jgi:hypothetical protein
MHLSSFWPATVSELPPFEANSTVEAGARSATSDIASKFLHLCLCLGVNWNWITKLVL